MIKQLKNVLKTITVGCVFLLCGHMSLIAQQDAVYSQYMFNKLFINPAYAGSKDALSLNFMRRNQWVGIPGAPLTNSLSAQGPLRNKHIALGLELFSTTIGPKVSQGLAGTYSYKIPLRTGNLALGLKFNLLTYTYNWNLIDFKDPNEVYNATIQQNKKTYSADFGIFYSNQSGYAGISCTHLAAGKTAYNLTGGEVSELVPHIFIMAGKAYQVNKNVILNPSFLFKAVNNAPLSIDLNFNALLFDRLWLGVSARLGYGFTAITQYIINDKFKIGYGYDLGLNQVGIQGLATHEILLQYDFNITRAKIVSPRYF